MRISDAESKPALWNYCRMLDCWLNRTWRVQYRTVWTFSSTVTWVITTTIIVSTSNTICLHRGWPHYPPTGRVPIDYNLRLLFLPGGPVRNAESISIQAFLWNALLSYKPWGPLSPLSPLVRILDLQLTNTHYHLILRRLWQCISSLSSLSPGWGE